MPLVNDLEVKFKNGYVQVEHPGSIGLFGRIQGNLDLPNVEHDLAAAYYGLLHLETAALPQIATDVDYNPTQISEIPYWGFVTGDKITAPSEQDVPSSVRVVSIAVSEDAEGSPIYGLELHTKLQDATAHIARIIRKAGVGGAGVSESAKAFNFTPPFPPAPRSSEWTPFSLPGPVQVIESGAYTVPHTGRIVSFNVSVGQTGDTVGLTFLHNRVAFGYGVLNAGDSRTVVFQNEAFTLGDELSVAVNSVGTTPPANLLVVPRVTS